ncbi:hypothetical protein CCB80_10220 [Armatimonadetes bacterium Uphvl-Ar1]|nr:hypothetical protein CCB80_10220 [Armatimonadetes bacterium Uphvl-Ar1]
MSASVLYTNFGGMLVHEDRGGVERTYVHDEMGNTRYLLDSSNVTDTYSYTPYGQVTHAGTNVTPFTFIGALGYFATGWSHLTSYVRARWYSRVSGSWGSIDPLWPWQKAYQYVDGNPAMNNDPSGNCPALVTGLAGLGLGMGIGCAGGFIGSALGSFMSPQGSDPAWLCKAGVACFMAGITGAVGVACGPIGGCIAGAITGLLGQVLNSVCDNLVTGCNKNPFAELGGDPCKLATAVISAVMGCINGLYFNVRPGGVNQNLLHGGFQITMGKPTMNGLTVPWAQGLSGALRSFISRIFGASCPHMF